jgi:hypothetical protein
MLSAEQATIISKSSELSMIESQLEAERRKNAELEATARDAEQRNAVLQAQCKTVQEVFSFSL